MLLICFLLQKGSQNMKLGDYLKLSGLSQRAFGEKVGASQGMVSHVITGRYKPRGPNILSWCEATEWRVTPHDIDSATYPNYTDGVPEGVILPVKPERGLNNENQA